MVKQVLDPPEANPVPAVCVPPGARLMLSRLLKNGAGRYSPSFPSFLPEAA
jgi:hypothetical protein